MDEKGKGRVITGPGIALMPRAGPMLSPSLPALLPPPAPPAPPPSSAAAPPPAEDGRTFTSACAFVFVFFACSVLIGSTTGSTGGNESTVTAGISVAGFRDCLLHLSPGTGTGLAYFHVFLTTAAGNQYMHGVWSDTGTHQVNWNPASDSGTCVVAIPAGDHSVFVQLTQSAPYGTHTYTLGVYGRKV